MSSENEDPPTPSSEEEAPSAAYQLPKSDVNFAFGPKNRYWTRMNGRWRFVRSIASEWKTFGITEPYWVAFKHDVGVFTGGCDEDGDGKVTHTWNDGYMVSAGDVDSFVESREAYVKLYNWIEERVGSDVDKNWDVSITIGPKGSYFARSGTSHIAHALPKDLQAAIQDSESPPVNVALGTKGAWILLRADGTRTWNLRHAYPSLAGADHLPNDSNKVIFAALNPFVDDKYFLVAENGGLSYSATFSDNNEGKQLHEMTDSYMRMRARRDGSSFTHSMTLNGVPRKVVITPNSSPHETSTDAWLAMLRARHAFLGRQDVAIAGVVAGGTGLAAKVVGLSTLRAVSMASSAGFGAGIGFAITMWFRGG